VSETLAAVEAGGLETAVAEHLHDLCIFCEERECQRCARGVLGGWLRRRTLTLLLEGELALLIVVLVLSPSPVLTTLQCGVSVCSLCARPLSRWWWAWRGTLDDAPFPCSSAWQQFKLWVVVGDVKCGFVALGGKCCVKSGGVVCVEATSRRFSRDRTES
jgi:hypothetical protein